MILTLKTKIFEFLTALEVSFFQGCKVRFATPAAEAHQAAFWKYRMESANTIANIQARVKNS